ncbi:MAG: cation:proton antiporter [Gemmatimonas sp.]|jgi:CPA2 family monovalent cation:H+ antiporter-2|uniref:cation:proton antiporter domain-containing protein n=1 Tax=Gemmatimonas sp. TaxID=1962908 RepID=UPI0022BEADCC|nr:cation:proton antiporter [Gemmatimonas sp.]MCA2983241.1 cation:proton antiporter [Gemmatimonas sp.]MCE2955508.1 cation:proton antiporter [Gemmatimonas sp.]MCZ8011183.1 cation:proton antiporter [Gemmatimonas sp.]MCZ8265996.1 cation:proton antiporter [Gemmatimonas sp.]
MHPETALLVTLAGAFGVAFLFGFVAAKLKLPPLVGYLLAGIALGPHSPGFVADVALAGQLAEIGVILLMFGVGLHFSPGDLKRVQAIVVPGATLQMAVSFALGTGLALWWGWTAGAAVVFGLSLFVASTVVVLRVLEDRGMLDSVDGRVAVGWLIVEDLGVVFALVLLPAILGAISGDGSAGTAGDIAEVVALTVVKVVAFIALMGLVGRRAVPWLLTHVARTGSRELFTLAVLAVSLGVAMGAAALFGVSFALGAFVAGVVISESDLSYRAGADALPMQDAFAVIFFVSTGMLLDPGILLNAPGKLLAVLGVILVGNAIWSTVLMILLRHPFASAVRIGAAFGQIGEFSFIMAALGVSLGVLAEEGRSLILAAALVSIVLNPLLSWAAEQLITVVSRHPALLDRVERHKAPRMVATDLFMATPVNHVIVIGYGRVGRTIGEAFQRVGVPFVAIEQDRRVAEAMRTLGVAAVYGDATRPGILEHARPEYARLLVVASPDPYHARRIIELARVRNPDIDIIVRTHADTEQEFFEQLGVGKALMGERELAFGMAYHALRSAGCDDDRADEVIAQLRGGGRMPTREFSQMLMTGEAPAPRS